MEKYYLMLKDNKYVEELRPEIEKYGAIVVYMSKLIPVMAVEFDPKKINASKLEKILLDVKIGGEKVVKSVEKIPSITYPEKHQQNK